MWETSNIELSVRISTESKGVLAVTTDRGRGQPVQGVVAETLAGHRRPAALALAGQVAPPVVAVVLSDDTAVAAGRAHAQAGQRAGPGCVAADIGQAVAQRGLRHRPERVLCRHPPAETGRAPLRQAAFLHPAAVPVPGPVLPVATTVQAAANDPAQLGRTAIVLLHPTVATVVAPFFAPLAAYPASCSLRPGSQPDPVLPSSTTRSVPMTRLAT